VEEWLIKKKLAAAADDAKAAGVEYGVWEKESADGQDNH
jgi:hypothetical protein